MNYRKTLQTTIKCSALSTIAIANSLYAIERPVPAAQPTEKAVPGNNAQVQAKPIQDPLPMPEVNARNTAYLGVFGQPVPATLSAHLGLPVGTGIQLELVMENSPAFKAGLEKHDIITSLAGAQITTMDDLRAAVSNKKPGDTVELNYISKGQKFSKDLVLGKNPNSNAGLVENNDVMPAPNPKKPIFPNELGDFALPKEFLEKFPAKDREKLMKLFNGELLDLDLDLQELREGMGNLEGFDLNLRPKGLNPEINKGLKFNSRIKTVDEQGSVTIETTNDGKVIELHDKEGKLQYRGPYNTDDEKKSVPHELRDRIENSVADKGLGFMINPKMNLPNELPGNNDLKKQLMDQLPEKLKNQLLIPEKLEIPQPQKRDLENKNGAQKLDFNKSSISISQTRTDPSTGNRYTLKSKNGNKQVEVHDAQGKLLFEGPYNTDADKASIPGDLQDYIELIEEQGFKFKK